MKILLGKIELARGLALRESPRRFALETTRETQIATALRADAVRALDRGNAKTVARFTVARRHESLEAALRFACTHASSLANSPGYLTLILEDGPGAAELHLTNAAVRSVRCAPAGLTTDTEYEFVGGAVTAQAPTD